MKSLKSSSSPSQKEMLKASPKFHCKDGRDTSPGRSPLLKSGPC